MNKQSYLELSYSLNQDILKNNAVGAVAASSLIYCNTKCWHGLLSVYNPETKKQKILLSTLDDAVIDGDKTYYLSVRKYPDVFFPLGHQYIKDITFNPFTKITYQAGEIELIKEILLSSNEETMLIKYALTKSPKSVKLQIRPIVAFRDAMSLTRTDKGIITTSTRVANGISYHPRKEEPMLFMQTSPTANPCEFVSAPDWNYNIEYIKDQAEGKPYQEDLFMPGYFEIELNQGEEVYFSASTKIQNPDTLAAFFKAESGTRNKRKNYEEYIKFSASQMFREVDGECQVLEKIPSRDYFSYHLLAALPGLTLPDGNFDLFVKTAKSYIAKIKNNAFGSIEKRNYDAHSPLWLIWAIQQYGYQLGDFQELYKTFGKTVTQLVKAGMDNRIPGLHTNHNGLISMERNGSNRYFADVNALWYNALMYAAEINSFVGNTEFSNNAAQYAKGLKLSFNTYFVDRSTKHLADSINDDGDKDMTCRPGQILAFAMPFPVGNEERTLEILSEVEEKLLTPLGLRSCPADYAKYHQDGEGDIYPIYLCFLAELYLKTGGEIEGMKNAESIYRMFDTARIEIESPNFFEKFDPEPPYRGKGSPLFAGTVAAINRIKLLMDQF
ncbi:MAG: glycogen debranching enzyme family protein [Bacteroidales bacterium]|nr:glycogen debranching enzyme family protein [Bacteroidales bacterium]